MAMETKTHLVEAMQTEILARLPLKSISRFKSVCKTWKSTIESAYFRRLFLSLNRNSSSWSLMYGRYELIVFNGRKTWDYHPKSPASLIPHSFRRYDSSGGLVLITDGSDNAYCYVGSPVTQQWIKIPPPPSDPKGADSTLFGLMTRLDQDGVVLSFKVVRIASYQATDCNLSSVLSVLLYSSETGIWTSFPITGNYAPMAMHPFDVGTVYLWSQRDHHLVSCNLRKRDYTLLRDSS
ncbi:F-box protein [Raphanus sativus]|nr:F-box protein [Raphanus sativus]